MAAFGVGGSMQGTKGAIATIAQQPYGDVLLILIAAGLTGYMVWSLIQALADTEGKGTDLKGIAARASYAASAIAHGGLAYTTIRLATSNGGAGTDSEAQRVWSARLLSLPAGRWLVGAVALVIVVVAVQQFRAAWKMTFMETYDRQDMSEAEQQLACKVGRWGLSARGATFLIIGWFFCALGVAV